jgi:hypothetical protein
MVGTKVNRDMLDNISITLTITITQHLVYLLGVP